jgi:hypothetical protein
LPIVYATPTGQLSHSPDGARQATDSVVCRHFHAHHWLDQPDQVRVSYLDGVLEPKEGDANLDLKNSISFDSLQKKLGSDLTWG